MSLHFRAANAHETQIGNPFTQRGDKMRPEKIAGGLAGHHAHDDGVVAHRGYRMIPRREPSRKSTSTCSSGQAFACAAIFLRASLKTSPERYRVL